MQGLAIEAKTQTRLDLAAQGARLKRDSALIDFLLFV